MKKYKIKNWEKYQHYKDRCPPWIKLHWELLSSKDWVMLDDASRLLAIVIMLIASRNDGIITDDPEYIQRVAYLNEKPKLDKLLEVGFIIMLADASDCKQEQANVTTETEKSREDNIIQGNKSPGILFSLESEKTGKPGKFKKPSLEDVRKYCYERQNAVKPETFFNFYESNGWKVGKNAMKDWQAAVRTWETNNLNNDSAKPAPDANDEFQKMMKERNGQK